MAALVLEINEDEIKLPRFTINGEISTVQAFQYGGHIAYRAPLAAI